ncbi:hypothetical protein GCM10009639_37980 [Kitasatospora putterlickiae]|uniref:Uncharacterized protein n=1 Tax=Kitasatospora putterlickiae TaxID=221725 RepID=A0ABN1Y8A6_9ACTN
MSVHDVARRLPAVPALRDLCRAMAAVEAVLAPGDPYRRHGFGALGTPGREVAGMDNGAGDSYTIVFSAAGAIALGFDHESPLSPYAGDGTVWPGVLDTVPEAFRPFVDDDGPDAPEVTVCLWRQAGDDRWHRGDVRFGPTDGADPDGANHLFSLLVDGRPEGFRDWAEEYYEQPVPGGGPHRRRVAPVRVPAAMWESLATSKAG